MEKSSDLPPEIELLTKFKLFTELDTDELSILVEQSTRAHFAAGDRIIATGEVGHCMYVILRGEVHVTVESESGDVELAVLGVGDFFGEVALVDDGPRSATVTASADCELLTITRMTLGVLAGLQPAAAIHLLAAIGRSLVARVRAGNQKYMDLIVLSRHPA